MESGKLQLIKKMCLPWCAVLYVEIGWMFCVGVTTYGRRCGRIYVMFLSWGEGALINLQYALQMVRMSGSTRRCCISGSSDLCEGKGLYALLCGNLKGHLRWKTHYR